MCDTNYQSQLGAQQMVEMYTRRPTTELITGVVTQIQGTFGMISREIFFQMSHVVGPVPKLGDKVVVEAEPVVGMPFKFNSTRVQIVSKDLTSIIPTPPPPPPSLLRMKAPPPPRISEYIQRTSKLEKQVNSRINRLTNSSHVSADLKTDFRDRESQRKKLDELYPEMTFVNLSVSPKEETASKTSKNKGRRSPSPNRDDFYRRRRSQKIRSKSVKRHSKSASRKSSNRSKSPVERLFRDPERHRPSSSPNGNRKRRYHSPTVNSSKRASPLPNAERRSKRQKMRHSPSPPPKLTERRSRLSDWLSSKVPKKLRPKTSEKNAKHSRSPSPIGSPRRRSSSSVKLLKPHSQKKSRRSSSTAISDKRHSNVSQKAKIEPTKKENQTSSPIVPSPEISKQLPIQIPGQETPQNDLKIPNAIPSLFAQLVFGCKIKSNEGKGKDKNPELQCHNCLEKGHPAIKCPHTKDNKAYRLFLNQNPSYKKAQNRQRNARRKNAKLNKQLQEQAK